MCPLNIHNYFTTMGLDLCPTHLKDFTCNNNEVEKYTHTLQCRQKTYWSCLMLSSYCRYITTGKMKTITFYTPGRHFNIQMLPTFLSVSQCQGSDLEKYWTDERKQSVNAVTLCVTLTIFNYLSGAGNAFLFGKNFKIQGSGCQKLPTRCGSFHRWAIQFLGKAN